MQTSLRRRDARPVVPLLVGYALTSAAIAADAIAADSEPRSTESAASACDQVLDPASAATVAVPAGFYRSFFKSSAQLERPGNASAAPATAVAAFDMDANAVTRGDYLRFVCKHPAWRRSNVTPLFAETGYLADWPADLDPGSQSLDQPVTHISWFAARAFCAARNARLPTIAEWERAGGEAAATTGQHEEPSTHPGQPFRFAMGRPAADLQQSALTFAGVWEWTFDFNSAVASSPNGSGRTNLFCGDGLRSNNARDYGAFLRYSLRSSLRGNYTLKNLGFRCVREPAP